MESGFNSKIEDRWLNFLKKQFWNRNLLEKVLILEKKISQCNSTPPIPEGIKTPPHKQVAYTNKPTLLAIFLPFRPYLHEKSSTVITNSIRLHPASFPPLSLQIYVHVVGSSFFSYESHIHNIFTHICTPIFLLLFCELYFSVEKRKEHNSLSLCNSYCVSV